MSQQNFMSYGDAETLFTQVGDSINHVMFTGTNAEWLALSSTEKAKYSVVNITDDESVPTALNSNIKAIVNMYGSKNLAQYPYYETTKAQNGLVFTDLGNGKVKITYGDGTSAGSPPSETDFRLNWATPTLRLKSGTYKLTGTPSGLTNAKIKCGAVFDDSSEAYYYDNGEGVEFTLPSDANIYDEIVINSNTVIPIGGVIFEYMIRDARITDDTYVPYAMTNKQLTDGVSQLNSNLSQITQLLGGDVVATANANQTYSAQMSTLYTAYQTLTKEQQAHTRIIMHDDSSINMILYIGRVNTAAYGSSQGSGSGMIIEGMRLSNSRYEHVEITGNGATYANWSTNTNTMKLSLVKYI